MDIYSYGGGFILASLHYAIVFPGFFKVMIYDGCMNNPGHKQAVNIHYGWYVVAAGTLCVFACLGLGRFALGMLLPSMGEALELSYSQMGFIGTANFVGYLVAVLLCSRLSKRFGARKLIGASLLMVGLPMIFIGLAANFYLISLLYIVTGMGSALANVSIMALIPVWFASRKRGKAAGFVVIGSGFAIILSGKLVPYLNSLHAHGWRLSWCVLGAIVLLAAALCFLILRDRPQDLGLQPVGSVERDVAGYGAALAQETQVKAGVIYHCAAIYFLFGFTYVIYATFIVTTLVQERGMSEAIAGNFWAWVGFLSLFSGPLFGTISDRFGRKHALVAVFSIQAMAYLFIALNWGDFFLYLSIGCYGIVAWSIPSIMAALVGDYVGAQRAVHVFAFVTFVFGLGQVLGPFVAGILAEKAGSFISSYLMAFILALSAVLLSGFLPAKKNI
ncbi:MAG: MFS transporter [Thermodesulfobacteriota bacterium]